jgi:hypothetical protein
MCTPYMSNYYLCDFFIKITYKKLKGSDRTKDVYILHVNRYAVRICIRLER